MIVGFWSLEEAFIYFRGSHTWPCINHLEVKTSLVGSSYSFLIQAIHLLPHNFHFWQVSGDADELLQGPHFENQWSCPNLNEDFTGNYLGMQTSDPLTHLECCLPQNHGVVLTEFCVYWGHMPVTLVFSTSRLKGKNFSFLWFLVRIF